MNKTNFISILFLLTLVLVPQFALSAIGQNEPTPTPRNTLEKPTGPGTSADNPLVECGGVDKNGREQPECTVGHLSKLFQYAINLVFILSGFIVAGMFMYAGFLMITSVGNASQIQKAKDIFRRVVVGFLIMFLSYIIVKNLLTNIKAVDFFINLFKK